MNSWLPTNIKICCISSKEEAALAIRYGASAIGLVGPMPSGPGIIDDALIKEIAGSIPPPIATFLLTSERSAAGIIAHHKRAPTTTIQLVDALQEETYQEIRAHLPSIQLIQVIHVLNETSVQQAIQVSQHVDALLLDSGNPNLAIKELGGTGRTHNWALSRTIRDAVSIPLYLAGGLNATNVRRAIEQVQPYGVDLCSGVRTNGRMDELKLKAFFEAVRGIELYN